jgi:inosose dehydratase
MTLGFSSYGMKTLKTEKAIDVISRTGFDAVELTVWPGWDASPESMSKARRREIRQRLADRGLVLSSLMEHIYPAEKDSEHKQHLARLQRVYELAHDLSPAQPPLVQTVLGGGQWEKKKQLFVDRVGSWAELGETHKIVTCVKPHRGGGMSQPSEFVWLIKQLQETKWVRMVYDYSHYIFRDIPFVESIKQSLPYTAHVAIKDTVNDKGKMRFVLPGEAGTIDFLTLIKTLHAGKYRGDISCEVSGMVWSQPGYDPIKAAQTCFNNLAPIFKQAGLRT